MVKRHKRSLTLAALVLLLAQVFLMTFCNITAIAVTKNENSKSLFENEQGKATVSYEDVGNDRLKWTVDLNKATQETATRFMVEVSGDGQAVTPENVQTLSKSNQEMNFASGNGDGQITAGMYEKTATTNGSAKISFETGRSYTTMTVKPKLITNADPATDLLAGNTGVSFTLPVAVTPESESAEGEVAASEVPTSETATSESSATEATSSTEVAATEETTATSEVTESTSTEQSATTDSTEAEATEESDVEDEADEDDATPVEIQPTASNYTSLKFNKTWEFGDVDPDTLTEAEKTIEVQVMRRIKGSTDEWKVYDAAGTGNPDDSVYTLVYPQSELEWHMLPAKENRIEYEYTAVEKNSPYYEITSNVETPSAIDSLSTVQNNSSTEWHQTNPSYIVTRNTDGSWLIWTADHVSESDRQAFADAIVKFGVGKNEKQPYKDFASIKDHTTSKFTWVEGDVNALGITITVDETENDVQVTLDFGHTNVWTQFMYGSHSTKRVDVTNTYIEPLNLTVHKEWQGDEKYKDYTRKDIQLVLQQKTTSTGWKDYDTFELKKGDTIFDKDFEVPSKVYVETKDGEKVLEDAQYQVVEVLTGSNPKQYRVPGYAAPVNSPESTSDTESTLTVTNTLLTKDLSFTKYDNNGTTPLSGITFEVVGDNGFTQSVTTDDTGKVDFTGLPVGNYTLTEKNIPVGYDEKVGPWKFAVVDNEDKEGTLSIEWSTENDPQLKENGSIVNKLKPFDLTVNKTNDQGNPLSGAVFTLNGEEFPATVSEDGTSFTFTGLTAPGTYTLHEKEAPDGYRGLAKDIVIVIDEFGKVTIDGEEQTNVLVDGEGNNQITMTVENDPKAPLPSTGGPGTLLFTLIGMVTLGAAGMYVFFRKDQEVA